MPNNEKQNYLIMLLLMFGLLLTIGCNQQPKSETTRDKNVSTGNDQMGYFSSDNNGVMFIRWTEINNKLTGQMNIFYAKGSRGKSTETSSHSFEGVTDGKNITLNFTSSQWTDALGGKTWTGTISGNELTLIIPVNSGTLEPVKFRAGTVGEYNQAVAGIKQGVKTENTRVQKEEAEAARIASEQKAIVETYEQVREIANSLGNGSKTLKENVRYDDIIKAYARTWDKTQSDYTIMKEEAARLPLTSSQFYSIKSVLYTLQSDVYSMNSHGYSMASRRDSTNDKIKTIEEGLAKLQKAWTQFRQARSANSTWRPEISITEDQISRIIEKTQDEIKRAKSIMDEAQKQASIYDKQARDLYKQAEGFVKNLKPADQ